MDAQAAGSDDKMSGIEEKAITVLANGRVSSSKKKKTDELKPSIGMNPKHKKIQKHKLEQAMMLQMTNQIMMREILRLNKKKKSLKEKKAKRKRRDPTDKQKAQWGTFASRVAAAKAIYYSQPVRTPKAWNDAMKKASGKAVDDEDETYNKLVEGLDPATLQPEAMAEDAE